MKRLTKRWGEQPYPNLAGKAICEYKECDSAKSCKDCVHGRIAERLAAYEDTGLEPEDILRILDAYGRGMTLRTESAQRLEIVKGIQTDRLRELAEADRKGKIPKHTIGDTIYDRFNYAWEVTDVELHLLAGEPKWIYRCGHIGTNDYCALWEFEVLTHAEAQAALRREQE